MPTPTVKPLSPGIVHVSGTTSGGLGGAAFHAIRIDKTVAYFVIGSSFGGSSNPNDTRAYRTANSVGYLNSKLSLNKSVLKKNDPGNKSRKALALLWMSNGVFFGPNAQEKEGKMEPILGPVVMSGVPISDIAMFYTVQKRSRSYYAQKTQSPSYGDATGGATSTQLASRGPSVIGGGASLISNGSVHNDTYWETTLGFDGRQPSTDKAIGPIIASDAAGRLIYLVMFKYAYGWAEAAAYMNSPSHFLRDIGFQKDPGIQNAIVYDGGASPQLFVRGSGIVVPNSRPVPHRICLWG